jgi:ABC-2 type transport system permease protein
MNKLFHRGYFKEIFRQLKTAGIVGACFLMLANVTVILELIRHRADNFNNYSIPSGLSLAGPFMAFIYIMGVILAFNAFGWLNKRSTSDFYHSIPVTRTAIYGSSLLAVFVWLMIGIAAFAAATVLIYAAIGAPFNYFLYLCVLGNMVIATLEVMGAAAIACAISGTRFVDLIAAAVILFIPRFLLTVLGVFVWRYGHESLVVPTISPLFDPTFNMIATPYAAMVSAFGWRDFVNDFANGWAMIYNLVYSLILVFLGGVAFNKRKSEHAGMATTKGVFQHIIRTAIGLPFLLIMVFVIKDDGEFSTGCLVLLILAFVAYCLYELISTKSAKRMLKAMPLFVICLGISVLYFVLPELISKAELSKRADVNNIKGITIIQEDYYPDYGGIGGFLYNSGTADDYVTQMQNKVVLNDPDAIKIIANAYGFTSSREHTSGNGINVKIFRKGLGGTLTRCLTLSDGQYIELMKRWNDSEECRKIAEKLPDGRNWYICGSFTRAENKELGSLFKEEYNALTPADKETLRGYYIDRPGYVHLIGCKGADNYRAVYRLNSKTPKTTARYYEILNSYNEAEVKQDLEDIVSWMENWDWDGYFSINIYDPRAFAGSECILSTMNFDFKFYSIGPSELAKDTDPVFYELMSSLKNVKFNTDPSSAYLITITRDVYGSTYERTETNAVIELTGQQLELIAKVIEAYGNMYEDVAYY